MYFFNRVFRRCPPQKVSIRGLSLSHLSNLGPEHRRYVFGCMGKRLDALFDHGF